MPQPHGEGVILHRGGGPCASGQADLCCIHVEQSTVGGIGQLTGFSMGTEGCLVLPPMSRWPKGHLLRPLLSPVPAARIRAALQ